MTNRSAINQVPDLYRKLRSIVNELEALFPGRRFTPDGHMVGSIGEVLAAYMYDLELLPNSSAVHDAKTSDGRLVQIKVTQGKTVAIRSEPEYLLVLKLEKDGTVDEIYNAPGNEVWSSVGKKGENGQSQIGIGRMRMIQKSVPEKRRLQLINDLKR